MARLSALLVAVFLLFPMVAHGEAELLMAEEPGCPWCARWNDDIGPIYAKTPEATVAPLKRYDLRDGTPDGVELERSVNFTPTFILVNNGKEVGRIEGYPGEDFFWALLGMLLKDAGIEPEGTG